MSDDVTARLDAIEQRFAEYRKYGSVWRAEESARDVPWLIERLREHMQAHELMATQFRIMQAEKEHGWREAEKREAAATRAEAAIDRVTDLFEKWAAEENEHRDAGEYGLAEGLRVASIDLRAALDGEVSP